MSLLPLLRRVEALGERASALLEARRSIPLGELGTREKALADYVTKVDLEMEAFFREELERILPGSSFLGEESGLEGGLEGDLWIVDPLDGTTNFSRGLQPFGFSLGLLRDGEPLLGVLGVPCMGWLLGAVRGEGAFLGGRPFRLEDRPLGPGSLLGLGLLRGKNFPRWADALLGTKGRLRFLGSAVVHLAGTALGRLDLAAQAECHVWDVAGGIPILEEAGGRILRLNGTPLVPFRGEELQGGYLSYLAGSPTALSQALQALTPLG